MESTVRDRWIDKGHDKGHDKDTPAHTHTYIYIYIYIERERDIDGIQPVESTFRESRFDNDYITHTYIERERWIPICGEYVQRESDR